MESKVVHVVGALVAGGAERFVVDLLLGLKRSGLSVSLLALSSRRDAVGEAMCRSLREGGVPHACGPTKKVGVKSAIWYIGKLKEIGPAIVHLHTENTELAHYIACKLYKNQHLIVRTIHSVERSSNRLHRLAFHYNPVDISIACSDAVHMRCASVGEGEIVTIPNGVSFDWPIQTTELREFYQRKLNLSIRKRHFVHVGRMSGESLDSAPKAHDLMIKAWKRGGLGERGGQLHLLGDGGLREKLKHLAGRDTSITFQGVRDDVSDWLLAANYYVMPSRYEGLPISGIEAVGTGLPCLFSDISSLRELGAHTVLWSTADDIQGLSENMIEACASIYEIPYADSVRIRKKFGIDKTTMSYVDCYKRICDQSLTIL